MTMAIWARAAGRRPPGLGPGPDLALARISARASCLQDCKDGVRESCIGTQKRPLIERNRIKETGRLKSQNRKKDRARERIGGPQQKTLGWRERPKGHTPLLTRFKSRSRVRAAGTSVMGKAGDNTGHQKAE